MDFSLFKKRSDKEMIDLISSLNQNEEILASDYSHTSYFEFTGENKNFYLNKLTHFDFRLKNSQLQPWLRP